jgi:hypothetical protein
MVSVARKVSIREERSQDQSCLFRKGDEGTKAKTPKTALGLSPYGDIFCALETNNSRT